MTLREHLERTATANTLVRQLSAGSSEFSATDADRVREFPDEALGELADAISMRPTWAEIESILRQRS